MSVADPRVVVIGGGLAGITAAIALAERAPASRCSRPARGSAARPARSRRDGLTVDTGQHIFLGCCTAYRGLLGKLGMTADAPVQDRFDVTVLPRPPGGAPPRPGSAGPRCPAPCICCPALARYPFLSLAERAVGLPPRPSAMRRVDPADPATDEQRFGDWLAAHGQSERARRALWDLFTVSALNIAGDDASLALAATVVKTGLLGKNNAADIGVPALPAGRTARRRGRRPAGQARRPGPPERQGRRHRAAVPAGLTPPRTADPGWPRAMVAAGRPLSASASPGPGSSAATELAADAVVLAVPHEKAAPLVPPGALPRADRGGLGGPGRLAHRQRARDLRPPGDGPALRGRRRLPGPVGLRPHPHLRPRLLLSTWRRPGHPVPGHLAVGRGRVRGRARGRSCASSSCPRWPSCSRPRATPGSPSSSSPASGARRSARRRAPPRCGRRPLPRCPGLVLAGAWTDTGWPDTMEGAVRSGLAAAVEPAPTAVAARTAESHLSPRRERAVTMATPVSPSQGDRSGDGRTFERLDPDMA